MQGNPDDDFSLSSVFNESYFVIPDYQRDYAWTKSNVNDLLDDAQFIYNQNKGNKTGDAVSHYFGTLVFEERQTIEPTDFEDFTEFAIVDGQQRLSTVVIVISAIVNKLDEIWDENIDPKMKNDIEEKRKDISQNYVEYEGIPRVQLGGLAEPAYEAVILGDLDADEYADNSDVVEAERKVTDAKHVVDSRLETWRKEIFDEATTDEWAVYYKFLKNIVKTITQRFEVNVKVVEDVDEAARMFKVINNRGRGLALHDKIRSHLVYCASQSSKLDSEDIYKQFNDIIENVTIHDGYSDDAVDDLVKLHWTVFTSERSDSRSKRPGPNAIHKRLAELEDYASVQREDFEEFIVPYLNSLEKFSQRYPYLSDRDKFAGKYTEYDGGEITNELMEETIQKIQSLYIHSSPRRATIPLLTAIAEKFGVASEEFGEVVSEVEKLVFCYSLVMSNGAQAYRNALQGMANDLYWADVDDAKRKRIFNSDSSRYEGYDSKKLGVTKVKEQIREKRERIAPIDDTIDGYLRTSDVLNGEFTSGWGGIRNTETIKYVMYEYERYLRDRPGKIALAPYHELRDDFEVEHLVPKNAEAGHKLDSHRENRNRIGNLAILSSKENKSNGNNSFEQKYEEIYRESSLKVLNTLNGHKFTVDDIKAREEEDIFPFVKERWG